MPRFVILEHIGTSTYKPGVHWDLLLEDGEVLRAWEVPQPLDSQVEQSVRQLPDHRKLYLDYEGPLSNNRGTVAQWDRGTYSLLNQADGKLMLKFAGSIVRGEIHLQKKNDAHEQWMLQYVHSER
jgi:hypothetical protein